MSGKILNLVIVLELVVLLGAGVFWYRVKSSSQVEADGVELITTVDKPDVKVEESNQVVVVQTEPAVESPVEVIPIEDEIDEQTVIATRIAQRQKKYAAVDSKDKPLGRLTRPSIVVEKSKFRLWVYDHSKPVKSYRVAVGGNSGHKLKEGDKRTPEGDYYVCVRKVTPATPYTRSLGLSYPGIKEARAGLKQGMISRSQYHSIVNAIKKSQCPPWNTALGGAIMIHGKRENRDSTLGCIALDDDDVKELYPQIPMGTIVRILP